MNLASHPQQSFQTELRRHILRASQISAQKWSLLGVEDDLHPDAIAPDSVEMTAESVTSLLLIRLLVLSSKQSDFEDFSTVSVCKTLLDCSSFSSAIPASITENALHQLRSFVRKMLHGYNDVPYHNFKVRPSSILVGGITVTILQNADTF